MRFPRLTPAARFNSSFDWSITVYKFSFELLVRVEIKGSYYQVIVHHHFKRVLRVTWLFTLLSPFSPIIAIWQRSAHKLELWRNTKKETNIKQKFILFELQLSTDLKNFTDSTQSAKKKQKCSWTSYRNVLTNQEKKMPFFLSTNTERQILVRNNFQRANYVNLHDGSKTLKFEDIARLKVMLHVTIRNNDL